MFERFTDRARNAVVEAQAAARRLRHPRVGTEHLLLCLLADREALAARVLAGAGLTAPDVSARIEALAGPCLPSADALATLGIDLEEVSRRIDETFGPGALERTRAGRGRLGGHIPFSPRAKKVLELSLREALALKHRWIGTEHILLGLLREGGGLGAQVLAGRLTYDAARAAIRDELADTG